MGRGKSGQQIALENLQRFRDWVSERETARDWSHYARGDKLIRMKIARECGFAVSVLRQNLAVKADLDALERCLRGLGITLGHEPPRFPWRLFGLSYTAPATFSASCR
jgi:hypothetical protein